MKKSIVLIISLMIPGLALAAGSWRDFLPLRSLIVAQNGMYPTLKKGEQIVLKSGFLLSREEIGRGQIVAFYLTQNGQEYIYIWRVVALAGDRLEIEPNGDITVNSNKLGREDDTSNDDPNIYIETNGDKKYQIAIRGEPEFKSKINLVVPVGHIYVLGDNRNHAADSRYHGTIPVNSVIAADQ